MKSPVKKRQVTLNDINIGLVRPRRRYRARGQIDRVQFVISVMVLTTHIVINWLETGARVDREKGNIGRGEIGKGWVGGKGEKFFPPLHCP